MYGILVGEDELIAKWTFETFNVFPMPVNTAIGILDGGKLLGAALFQNFNGYNVELSYYGPNTLSLGMVRTLARVAVNLNVTRCTITTSKRNRRLMRALLKFGFKFEGTSRCFYGPQDNNRNTGARFVMFRDRINYLAGIKETPNGQCSRN